MQSLAVKYRPHKLSEVVEQDSIKVILKQQLESGEIPHACLFVGSAGTGKTTIGRIFANEINKGKGNPLELDAASNNSVDDVRNIIQQAKVQSMDSEYRCFLIDECHSLSNSAWQAFLKLLEEPPAKSVFILCTTEAQKIPKTILSRVQRFNFKRISQDGIFNRLKYVIEQENSEGRDYIATDDALRYLSRMADGGMRDSLTLLDKCLAYSKELTIENVIQALGTVDYEVFFNLSDQINKKQGSEVIRTIEKVHADGKDLKQFIKDYMSFLLDINKYDILKSFEFLQIPSTYEETLKNHSQDWFDTCRVLLPVVVRMNSAIKWETQPKVEIEARLLGECIK